MFLRVVKVIWYKAASPPHPGRSVVFARWHQCFSELGPPRHDVTSVDVCVAFGRAVSDNDGFCGITGATPQCPVGIKHDGLDGNIRYSTSSLLLFSTTAIYIARKMSHMHYTQQRCKISSDLTILPVCVCQVCWRWGRTVHCSLTRVTSAAAPMSVLITFRSFWL